MKRAIHTYFKLTVVLVFASIATGSVIAQTPNPPAGWSYVKNLDSLEIYQFHAYNDTIYVRGRDTHVAGHGRNCGKKTIAALIGARVLLEEEQAGRTGTAATPAFEAAIKHVGDRHETHTIVPLYRADGGAPVIHYCEQCRCPLKR